MAQKAAAISMRPHYSDSNKEEEDFKLNTHIIASYSSKNQVNETRKNCCFRNLNRLKPAKDHEPMISQWGIRRDYHKHLENNRKNCIVHSSSSLDKRFLLSLFKSSRDYNCYRGYNLRRWKCSNKNYLFLIKLSLFVMVSTWLLSSKQCCLCLKSSSLNFETESGNNSNANQRLPSAKQPQPSPAPLLPKPEGLLSPLMILEPTAGTSIFGSLLGGGGSNSGNQAAQQQSQADLHQAYKNGQASDKVTLPGDILLGGLFPIHMKGTKVECGEINRDRGIQRLEAMLYALDRINEDSQLLPKIKLGAILLDSCSSSTYALNQSLEFIRASINTVESSAFECRDKSTPRPKYGSKMIAGVIGGSYSEVSLQVANLLRLFRIPQVSYASTGTALSDKTLYDLFARTVPSDMFQARAIADIVEKLSWSYVSLVSSEGLYGDSGSKEFMKQASARRICIATHEKISPTMDANSYDSLVENLKKRNATGVVLFTRAEDTRELLLAVKRAQLLHNFAWVAADGWGTHQKLIEGVEEIAWGAITVELAAKAIPGFDQYMRELTPWQNVRNPWFSEYWQEWFDCQLQVNLIKQQELASGSVFNRRNALSKSSTKSQSSDEYYKNSNADDEEDQEINSEPDGSFPADGRKKRRKRRNKENLMIKINETNNFKDRHKRETAKLVMAGSGSGSGGNLILNDKGMVKQFCSPNLRISESNGYRQEQKVQFVVDAVYAMAHALHKAWFNLCGAQEGVVCEALKELNGAEFYGKYLLNVSFQDLAGSEVKFDERGDGLGRYNIYNFRRSQADSIKWSGFRGAAPNNTNSGRLPQMDQSNGLNPSLSSSSTLSEPSNENLDSSLSTDIVAEQGSEQGISTSVIDTSNTNNNPNDGYPQFNNAEHVYTSGVEFEYSPIGRWTESDYYLRLDDIQFIQGDKSIPESYCSKPCELGQAKIMRAGDHCCWICKTCAPYEYLPDEFSCSDCGIGRWPTPKKTACFDLPQKILRWDSVYSLISLTIACLGIGLTAFVSIIFIKYLDTPVVKASGRELSFILLAGIAFCHLSTFVLLSKPTTIVCTSQRFLVNFGFSLMYASLLVKTNRISRIFNCARKSAKRPSFISPRSQMIITAILVGIQVFLTIVWFVFEPPGTRADSPEGKRDEVILKCRVKGKSFIISLVYNMILITTCTVYAVKTRKIPENFNESKFIGFTMYTTIVIWLAFVTMFFGTNNSYEIQMNTMCVCISLSAYVTLFCLFSPKLSIILLHPDKNVRKLTMNSATYKRPFKPVSSFASVYGNNNNQAGSTYNNQQTHTDGGSGGPMSTTSNVLNLGGDNQGAKLQESSIVSNVVNSNSSQSQKTPTTLSHQLTLVGTCINCGSQQVQAVPSSQLGVAGSSHSGDLQTSGVTSGNLGAGSSKQHSSAGADLSKLNRPTNSQHQLQQHQHQRDSGNSTIAKVNSGKNLKTPSATTAAVTNTSFSRSSILVSSTTGLARATSSASPVARPSSHAIGQVSDQTGSRSQGRDTGSSAAPSSSAAMVSKATTAATTALAAKIVHSKISQQTDGNGNNLNIEQPTADLIGQQTSGLMSNLAATTPANKQQREQIEDSLSNESIVNNNNNNNTTNSNKKLHAANLIQGQQQPNHNKPENCFPANDNIEGDITATSTTNGGSGAGGTTMVAGALARRVYVAGKGSDSMLWNQSLYSIDYCSDCCPSMCHCSCQACGANGSVTSQSNNGDEPNGIAALGGTCSSGALCAHTTPRLFRSTTEPGSSSGGVLGCDDVGRGGVEDTRELDDYELMCDSLLSQTNENEPSRARGVSEVSGEQALRRRKSEDRQPYFLPSPIKSSGRRDKSSCKKTRRSQTMEMRPLMGATTRTDDSKRTGEQQIVYAALQAAASSALGPIGAHPIASEKKNYSGIDIPEVAEAKPVTKAEIRQRKGTTTGSKATSIEHRSHQYQYQHQQQDYGCIQMQSDSENLYYQAGDEADDDDHQHQHQHQHHRQETKTYSRAECQDAQWDIDEADDDLDDELGDEDDFISDSDYLDDDENSCSLTRTDDQHSGAANRPDSNFYDDNFEHDGRVSLQKLSAAKRRRNSRQAGGKQVTGRGHRRNKDLEPDEHRINSVALITATLSAGGAIVESVGTVGNQKAGSSGSGLRSVSPGNQIKNQMQANDQDAHKQN